MTHRISRPKIVPLWAGAFLLTAGAAARGQPQDPHQPEGRPHYRSSQECKRCHPSQFEYWSNSMHASAATDPVFQVAYGRAIASYGVEIREFCLGCHAPTTRITGDYNLTDPLTREGVTCDFCHTVVDVELKRPRASFVIQLGDTKFGPLEGPAPVENLTFQYSTLHRSSKLCAGCHELYSDNGVGLLETYTEWGASHYAARDLQCQNCHMPELAGVPMVDPAVRQTTNNAHAHEFLGGHSQIRLERAAKIVTSTRREGPRLFVDVYVTNAESGHKIPTGLPTRQIVLTVTVADEEGRELASQERVYKKTLVDEDGNELLHAECVMVEATAVTADTRLGPGETRQEHFVFDSLPEDQSFVVRANLDYKFEAAVLERNVMTVPMDEATKVVAPAGGGKKVVGWIVAASAAGLLFLTVAVLAGRRRARPGPPASEGSR